MSSLSLFIILPLPTPSLSLSLSIPPSFSLDPQCSYCLNEAQYNCCWNANYCNETCQQNHWPEHMKNCTQVQQQQQPPTSARTPGPPEVSGGTPVATAAPIQFHPSMALMSNASGGGGGGAGGAGGAPVFTSGQEAAAAAQHQHQQNLLYMARSATAARTPQGQQQGIPHQQHIGVVNQIASGSLTVSGVCVCVCVCVYMYMYMYMYVSTNV